MVEAQLVDSAGRVWSFIDKVPIFGIELVGPRGRFPVAALIRCEIIGCEILADGWEIVTIDTGRPDGVDSDGETIFAVPGSAISDH